MGGACGADIRRIRPRRSRHEYSSDKCCVLRPFRRGHRCQWLALLRPSGPSGKTSDCRCRSRWALRSRKAGQPLSGPFTAALTVTSRTAGATSLGIDATGTVTETTVISGRALTRSPDHLCGIHAERRARHADQCVLQQLHHAAGGSGTNFDSAARRRPAGSGRGGSPSHPRLMA